jgi:hypothetical protein
MVVNITACVVFTIWYPVDGLFSIMSNIIYVLGEIKT